VDWNTPSDWLPVGVPNAPDADVVVPLITQFGTPYPFDITIDAAARYAAHSVSLTDATLALGGTLSIGAGLTLGAGGEVVVGVGGFLSVGSLANAAGTRIEGDGQVSSANSIDNQGEITNGGLHA
jgi:adhesin HecA-like repeat protein